MFCDILLRLHWRRSFGAGMTTQNSIVVIQSLMVQLL